MAKSSWLVGSFNLAANATVTINGSDQVIAAGDYYLYDGTPGQSLIDALETAIATVIAGSTVVVRKNRKVHIDFNATSATLVIPAELAEPLGYTSSPYGSATTRTAENVSTLLWSPGWMGGPRFSPAGVTGRKHWDRVLTASPTGRSFNVTLHHSTTLIDLSWSAVRQERAWTTSESPGEYVQFFEDVLVPGYRFKLYQEVDEDDSSSAAVTWPTGLGPYVVTKPNYDWYERFVDQTDTLGANISLKAFSPDDYS